LIASFISILIFHKPSPPSAGKFGRLFSAEVIAPYL